MILTVIVAALAGWVARPAEPRITEALLGTLGETMLSDAGTRRVLALLVALLGAALLLWILDAEGYPVLFVLSAGIGHFQKEIREAIVSRGS